MLPTAMLYVQKAEFDWPGADSKPRFKPEQPVTLLCQLRGTATGGGPMFVAFFGFSVPA